jgi:hypothetical protein
MTKRIDNNILGVYNFLDEMEKDYFKSKYRRKDATNDSQDAATDHRQADANIETIYSVDENESKQKKIYPELKEINGEEIDDKIDIYIQEILYYIIRKYVNRKRIVLIRILKFTLRVASLFVEFMKIIKAVKIIRKRLFTLITDRNAVSTQTGT